MDIDLNLGLLRWSFERDLASRGLKFYMFPVAKMAEANKHVRDFSTNISLYEKGSPEYTKESVEFLLCRVGVLPSVRKEPTKLLEIATGTGKFTRVMVQVLTSREANVEIIASDPLLAMCEAFRCLVPEIEMRQFPAESIGKILVLILV